MEKLLLPVVLVVEDHPDSGELLCHFMKGSGYSCVHVTSAAAAMTWLESNQPALIVLDESMPNMNGFELLALLKADVDYQSIPVIFFSASASLDRQRQAVEMGAVAWFTKGTLSWQLLTDAVVAVITRDTAEKASAEAEAS